MLRHKPLCLPASEGDTAAAPVFHGAGDRPSFHLKKLLHSQLVKPLLEAGHRLRDSVPADPSSLGGGVLLAVPVPAARCTDPEQPVGGPSSGISTPRPPPSEYQSTVHPSNDLWQGRPDPLFKRPPRLEGSQGFPGNLELLTGAAIASGSQRALSPGRKLLQPTDRSCVLAERGSFLLSAVP